jgi:hypothetical protein
MELFPFTTIHGFIRSRQLEGTFPGDRGTGIWPSGCPILRAAKGGIFFASLTRWFSNALP